MTLLVEALIRSLIVMLHEKWQEWSTHNLIWEGIKCNIIMTGTPCGSEFELKNTISYCSLIGKLLSVFFEFFSQIITMP